MKAHFLINGKLELREATTTSGVLHCNNYGVETEKKFAVKKVKKVRRTRKKKILMRKVTVR